MNPEPVFLEKERADIFHRTMTKLLWASLVARLDFLLAISFLTSRVKKPDKDNWDKLTRLVNYIQGSIDLKLRLCLSKIGVYKSWVDASFATREQRKSKTGGYLSRGEGVVLSFSKKQKLVRKSYTEVELMGVNDVLPQVLWTQKFLITQGWEVNETEVY